MSAPIYSFTVSVNTSTGTYTILDSEGRVSENPITVTVPGTQISYTLTQDSDELVFTAPEITGDTGNDLTWNIPTDGKNITITDTDANNELICLRLVTEMNGQKFVSPDPQIKNDPD